MCVHNMTSFILSFTAMPAAMPSAAGICYYSWECSVQWRNSMVLYGGFGVVSRAASPYLFEFTTATNA